MARLIDLSTPVRTGHFRWAVERRFAKTHDTGAGQATWAGWNVHAFTHMDSPRHVDPQGFTTDAVTLDMTVGPGAVVDVSDVPANTAIPGEHLAAAGAHVKAGDFVLVRTRWDERASLDTEAFWREAPWMTAEGSVWLRERGIKAVVVAHRPRMLQGMDKLLVLREGVVDQFGDYADIAARFARGAKVATVGERAAQIGGGGHGHRA